MRWLCLSALAACSGAAPTPAPDSDPAFAELARRDQIRFMKDRVVPLARELFAGYDADRYARVDCTTCHGDRALDGDYSMPNPDLLPLAFGPESGYARLKERRPAIIAFMKQTLSPRMARLLGREPWSERNPGGFGCFSCHPSGERIDPAALERDF